MEFRGGNIFIVLGRGWYISRHFSEGKVQVKDMLTLFVRATVKDVLTFLKEEEIDRIHNNTSLNETLRKISILEYKLQELEEEYDDYGSFCLQHVVQVWSINGISFVREELVPTMMTSPHFKIEEVREVKSKLRSLESQKEDLISRREQQIRVIEDKYRKKSDQLGTLVQQKVYK